MDKITEINGGSIEIIKAQDTQEADSTGQKIKQKDNSHQEHTHQNDEQLQQLQQVKQINTQQNTKKLSSYVQNDENSVYQEKLVDIQEKPSSQTQFPINQSQYYVQYNQIQQILPIQINYSRGRKEPSEILLSDSHNPIKKINPPIEISQLLQLISNSRSENEQFQKVKQLHNYSLQINDIQLETEVNDQACTVLKSLIDQVFPKVHPELLKFIEVLAQRGAQIACNFKNNQFLIPFQNSGLLNHIQILLKQQSKQEQIDKTSKQKFSQIFTLLVRIYSFMNKFIKIDNEYLEICGQIFNFEIHDLHSRLVSIANNEDCDDQQLQKNQQIENADNKGVLIEQHKIHEDLAPLIHLHCPSELRCTQCINLHESYNTHLFLCDVYETMANLIWLNDDAQDFLFSMELSQRNSSSQQSLIQHSQSNPIIVGALYLLCFLLTPNNIHCTNAGSIPGLIEAQVTLAKFRKNDYEQINNWKDGSDIRYWSNRNLNVMLQYGNVDLLKRILQEQNIIQIQVDVFGTSVVKLDQDSMVVIGALINIEQLYANLRYGNEVHLELPILIKFADETMEEEGGIEEIDSNSFHLQSKEFNSVQFHARVAVCVIINSKLFLQEQIQG